MAASLFFRTRPKLLSGYAFLAIYFLCKFNEASLNISILTERYDFQTIAYGSHFVFQNVAKILLGQTRRQKAYNNLPIMAFGSGGR